MRIKAEGLLRSCARLYPLVVVLVAWQLIALYGGMKPLLFPRLEPIGAQLVHLLVTGDVVEHLGITLFRTLSGFGLAVLLGVPIGFSMSRYRFIDRFFEPIFAVTYPIPRISLFPIFVLLFGLGHLSKISLITLECLYPIAVNTYYGTRSVNPRYLWAAQNMGANAGQMLYKVVVPAAGPYIFAGLRTALPVALVLAVLTEMISSGEGLGFLIAYSSSSLETARVFAALVYAGFAGFLLDRVLVFTRRRVIFWEGEGML